MQFRFGDHSLDTDRRELRRGGAPTALEPQVFDLLVYLVQNRDRVVTKDDLFQAVWRGRIVSESALTSRITAVRKAIGDDGGAQRLIRTVPRKGIRFIGEVREEARVAGASPSAPRLSIVVLPFENLSNDPDQEYFADGITDDLTTDLSRISGSFVIARSTAFTYKGKPIDVKQIGRELGVRYVLEGSVRRSGDHVRVNVQLIDAESGAHVWADRFETDRRNLADAQREITGRLAESLNLELVRDLGRRIEQDRAADPDARDLVMRGWAWYHRPRSMAATEEASSILRSLRLPSSASTVLGAITTTGISSSKQLQLVCAARASLTNEMEQLDSGFKSLPCCALYKSMKSCMARGPISCASRRLHKPAQFGPETPSLPHSIRVITSPGVRWATSPRNPLFLLPMRTQ